VLGPFCDQLNSPFSNNQLQTLKGLEKIIQTCGQQIKNDGWKVLIFAVTKTAEIENDQIIAHGFKCLKLIVSTYIEKLSQENFIVIINAIQKYASYSGDNINNSLTAVGMFWNIADYVAKGFSEQSSEFNAERIWNVLVERIQELNSDPRVEVRRANIHTFENILVTHGAKLSKSVWTQILKCVLLGMFQHSSEMYQATRNGGT